MPKRTLSRMTFCKNDLKIKSKKLKVLIMKFLQEKYVTCKYSNGLIYEWWWYKWAVVKPCEGEEWWLPLPSSEKEIGAVVQPLPSPENRLILLLLLSLESRKHGGIPPKVGVEEKQKDGWWVASSFVFVQGKRGQLFLYALWAEGFDWKGSRLGRKKWGWRGVRSHVSKGMW